MIILNLAYLYRGVIILLIMNNKAKNLLFLIILIGCSHQFSTPSKLENLNPNREIGPKPRIMGKTRAIFHLIAPKEVELLLLNQGTKKEESIIVDKTLSQIEMSHGDWEIVGLKLNHKIYRINKLKKKFVFHLKNDQLTYVGSYILDCAFNNKVYLSSLKKMSFYNIYHFSSDTNLCEMVVGSEYKRVNRVWKSLKSDNKSLHLGF